MANQRPTFVFLTSLLIALVDARRVDMNKMEQMMLDSEDASAEATSTGGGESSEIWIRAECEIPASVMRASSPSGQLKDTCYYLKAYEDQDVLPEESRHTKIMPIFQGATEGRYAEKLESEEEGAPWRVKFARLIPGEIEFEEFPETWEFELYGDIVRPVATDPPGKTHCKDPSALAADDRIGALAITGEDLKRYMSQKTMPKVSLARVRETAATRRFAGVLADVSQISCVFDFNEVQFENYMQSKAFGANFNFALSVDFTGSNTWEGPGEFDGMSGKIQLLRSKTLHHLADAPTLRMIENVTDWSDGADDPYNQYIMPIKRAVKTLSEYTSSGGADFAIFGGNLESPWVRTDEVPSRGDSEELVGLPVNPGEYVADGGKMPFATLGQKLTGSGDALAGKVVTSYIDAVKQCKNIQLPGRRSRGCWGAPTHILPSIYWEVRKILLNFQEKMRGSSDPSVAHVASQLHATDIVLEGDRVTPDLQAHIKNEECKDHTYHVLAIFTDGDWDDREQRRVQNFIGSFASKLPLSIVLVGVGEGDMDDACEECVEKQHGVFRIVESGDNCVCPPGAQRDSIKISLSRGSYGWQTRKSGECARRAYSETAAENVRLKALEETGGQANFATEKDGHSECSPFPRLEELDGDSGTSWYFLNWPVSKKPDRDIIQSVIMKGDLEDASKKISAEILGEIPDQMEDYFKNYCHLSPLGSNVETTLQEIEKLYEESMAEAQKDWAKYEQIKKAANDLHVQQALKDGIKPDGKEWAQFTHDHGITTPDQAAAETAKAQALDQGTIDSKLDLLSGMLDSKSKQAEMEQERANNADGGKEWTAGITPPLLVPELDSAADMCPPNFILVRDETGQRGDICQAAHGGGDQDVRCILKACQEVTVNLQLQRAPEHTRIRRGAIVEGRFEVSEAIDDLGVQEKLLEMKSEGVIAADEVKTRLQMIKREAQELGASGQYIPEHDGKFLVKRTARCVLEGRSFQHDGADALCKAPAVEAVASAPPKEKSGSSGTPTAIVAGGTPYSGTRKGKPATVHDDLLDLL